MRVITTYRPLRLLFLALLIACVPQESEKSAAVSSAEIKILPPQDLYGELFDEVQERTDLFPDSKTFVDVRIV